MASPAGEQPTICQVTLSRVLDSGGRVQGIVAVLRDVTQERHLEQLRSDLMSVVSHELRTPLHSINGFVDLILMGKTGEINETQRDFLRTVKQQSTQLQHIINDVLEFSRLEYGQVTLTTEPVEMRGLVELVFHKLALLAEEARIDLSNAMPRDLPDIPGDSVRLEQVLSNLIDNALKFTPSGGRIVVGGADLDDTVELWVSDSGIGIPMEEQSSIFEKFYQIANGINTPEPRKGAGLGLTICKHIVEQHEGDIWVESVPGSGSTFHVALPKYKRDNIPALDLRPKESAEGIAERTATTPSPLPRPSYAPRQPISALEPGTRASF